MILHVAMYCVGTVHVFRQMMLIKFTLCHMFLDGKYSRHVYATNLTKGVQF